jgi:hypothetical protein
MLADGGVITRPTLAWVGEDRRTAPEIVTPERLMRRIVREEGGAYGAPTIRVYIGDRELTDLVTTQVDRSMRGQAKRVEAGTR